MSRWESLANLRAAVARIERGVATARGDGVLPLGLAAVDRALGEGGLRRAALHEVSGSAADGFAAMLAGRMAAGAVLWCAARRGAEGLYPPGLAMLGLDPARLLLVDCRNETELLAAAEEGLRSPGLAAVVLEAVREPDMTAARRLQLAAETGGVLGLLVSPGASGHPGATRHHGAMAPGHQGAMAPGVLPPSPAVSRWRVDPAPGGEGTRWYLRLLRCRGGGTGEWMVDWNEKTHCLAVVPPAVD